MNRQLIVIEGTDGSGKSTQFQLLCGALERDEIPFRPLRFPRYGDPSSVLVQMYLSGVFGKTPGEVNPYAASMFFAADRYASFKTDWHLDWDARTPILCDRYTTSNVIHQASKLPVRERDAFLDWMFDFEYNKLGLPKPTRVFFLDMPSEITFQLLKKRQGNDGDIHERDQAYLSRCREEALAVSQACGWIRIKCAPEGRLRSPEDIAEEIYASVKAAMREE